MASSIRTSETLRTEAEQGDVRAQFELGRRYMHGQDVVRDFNQAAIWLQRAADAGHLVAAIYVNELKAKQEESALVRPVGFERWLDRAMRKMKRTEQRHLMLWHAEQEKKRQSRQRWARYLMGLGSFLSGLGLIGAASIWHGLF